MVPCSFSPTIAKTYYTQYHKWKRHIFYSHLNCQIPPSSPQWNWSCHALYAVSFPAFASMVTASYYYHTYAVSVIGTLLAAPIDNIYRISIFLTVVPQSLYANLFLILAQTLKLGSIVGTLQSSSAPPSTISQESVCSTTTFHNPYFRTTGLEVVTKSPNKE